MKYLILLFVLSSCGPNAKIARKAAKIQRLERQIQALGGKIIPDTVYVTQSIIVPETRIDSIVTVKSWTDTITVTKDRVTTKILVRPVEKTVYVSSVCDSVVIVKRVPVTVTRTINTDITKWKKIGYGLKGAGLLLLLLVVGGLVWRLSKIVKR